MSNKFWHGLSETLLWWRPAKEGEEKSRYMAIYTRLLGYARPYVFPDLALSVLAMLVLSAANGAIPYLLKETINSLSMIKANNPHNLARLHMLSLGILVVFVVRALTDFLASFLTDYIGMKTAMDLRAEFNDRLQRLPLSFFNWTPTGNLLTRALSDVQMASSIITNSLISLVGDSLTLVALVGGLFWMDFKFALLAFVVFPVAILPIIGAARRVRKTAKSAQRKLSDISVLMQEAVQGCRVVKAFGMENYESERFRAMLKKQLRMMRRVLRASAFSSPFIEVLGACAVVAVLWYGISAVLVGSRSPGTFAAFIGAMLIIYRPFKRIAGTNNSIQQGLVSAERVFAIIDHPPEIYEAPGALELKHGPHSIEFRKVNFRYDPNGEWVLRNINMKIGAGETIALVGMSGGGKSTLSDLIPRFYDPNKGEMLIDGVDAKRYTLKSLRAEIGLVSQHTFLFNDTIRTNIAYGGGSGDFDEIVAAAKAANAHDFITRLPNGYDTLVGELGVRLSGGERQRLAIARALLKNAPILILDEPTSNLDSEGERVVQDAIERLMVNRTTLMIAHRLSTVRRADRIFVIVSGEIVEAGTHEELLALDGAYRKLCDLQFYMPEDDEAPARGAANA
ncbi:MAG: ABC transporter ATP-binding protein [Candidatus Binataceae bacterium]